MRDFSVPLIAEPVGTRRLATTLLMPGSVATISRAPERGRPVVRRDQNVTALALGSPEATPSRNLPGPTPVRRESARRANAGGAASAAAPTAAAPMTSRRVVRFT